MVGRGAAYGDLDGDGDLDIVLVASGGEPRVLRNDQATENHWLRIQLTGSGQSSRSAYGARIELTSGGVTQTRLISPTRSYLSQCETIATFGLGKEASVERIVITWPDHSEQTITPTEIDTLISISQDSQ